MFDNLISKIFHKQPKIRIIRPKDEFEDSYETVPMFDIENKGNQITLWPNAIPLWKKLLVVAYMGLTFHFQIVNKLSKILFYMESRS